MNKFGRQSNYNKIYEKMIEKYNSLSNKNKISNLYNFLENTEKTKGIKNPDTVYIFGTGPSLFKLENKLYYRDRMTIGVNYSYEHLPFLKYVIMGEIETYQNISKKIDNSKILIPMAMNYNKKSIRKIIVNKSAHHYKIQNPQKKLEELHINLKKNSEILCYSTTTHSAIHIAAYMGAKKIYLVGCDYCLYSNGKVHFNSKDGGELYRNQDWHAMRKHRIGELWLKEQLKRLYDIDLINMSRNL